MKTCRHCGRIEPDNVYMCPACDRPLPIRGPSGRLLQRALLTLVIPLVVWVLMTRLLHL
jgi:hypothetical protein